MNRRSLQMTSIAQVESALSQILTERANVLAKETGAIRRVRKFEGADLLQTLVFGWMQHPDASLEQLSSTAAIAAVQVSDTAVHKRFSKECATFLHAVLEELLQVIVQAEMVRAPVGISADGGALFGSPQSPGAGRAPRGEPVCGGSGLLQPA